MATFEGVRALRIFPAVSFEINKNTLRSLLFRLMSG